MIAATDALFTLNSSLEHHNNNRLSDARGGETKSNGARTNFGDSTASGVTGVCFVKDTTSSCDGSEPAIGLEGFTGAIDGDHSDSDEDGCDSDDDNNYKPLQFRCSNLLLGPPRQDSKDCKRNDIIQSYQSATHVSAASHSSLSGAVLASCHQDGSCRLWNLATRRCIVNDICQDDASRRGSGLALRRVGLGGSNNDPQFLYQTRDPLGTVSLHDANQPCTSILQMHTYSSTFCAMTPCHVGDATSSGANNLVALPTEEHSVAVVRDLRCNPKDNAAWRVAIGDEYISSMYGTRRKYGMLTSLALCLQETTQRIVLGCGMENGSALFYDLGATGHGRDPWWTKEPEAECINTPPAVTADYSRFMCSATLGKDPVLCMDLVSSHSLKDGNSIDITEREHEREHIKETKKDSLVAVGGCAGDADDLSELPEEDQGTVSTIKVKLADDSHTHTSHARDMNANIRAKTRTCSVSSGGKVGVSICRFRPDGRVFAVGGWDHRLRIFGRTSSKPLAILRGHESSVTAADWANNAATSGLLATGAGDGKICIYRVFPHSSRSIDQS